MLCISNTKDRLALRSAYAHVHDMTCRLRSLFCLQLQLSKCILRMNHDMLVFTGSGQTFDSECNMSGAARPFRDGAANPPPPRLSGSVCTLHPTPPPPPFFPAVRMQKSAPDPLRSSLRQPSSPTGLPSTLGYCFRRRSYLQQLPFCAGRGHDGPDGVWKICL